MVGLWILGLFAGLAWINGWDWLVGIIILFLVLFISGLLSGLAGVSKYRKKKNKYHPVH